jgi:hypothetical protein
MASHDLRTPVPESEKKALLDTVVDEAALLERTRPREGRQENRADRESRQ